MTPLTVACPGDPELLSAALPASPVEQQQGVHPQGGLLDHLQHHRRQPITDSGQQPLCAALLVVVRSSEYGGVFVLFVGCLSSQQHASVSQGRICTDNFTCCHTEIEAADPTFHLTQSQYTDPGPTSPSADPITPGAWQGSHWSANF